MHYSHIRDYLPIWFWPPTFRFIMCVYYPVGTLHLSIFIAYYHYCPYFYSLYYVSAVLHLKFVPFQILWYASFHLVPFRIMSILFNSPDSDVL